MAKQITRWFGRGNRIFYEVWVKKPVHYNKKYRRFENVNGYSAPKEYLGYESATEIEKYFPILKGTKVGQIRKVRVIVD